MPDMIYDYKSFFLLKVVFVWLVLYFNWCMESFTNCPVFLLKDVKGRGVDRGEYRIFTGGGG